MQFSDSRKVDIPPPNNWVKPRYPIRSKVVIHLVSDGLHRLSLHTMSTSAHETPIGIAAALASSPPIRTALSQFLLVDKVALVTGGHRGIGLEIALALAEAGAIVYSLDLPTVPDSDWLKVRTHAAQLPSLDPLDASKKGRLEYMSADVTDQAGMRNRAEEVVRREGRLDICVANAGVLQEVDCLEYPAEDFRKVCRRVTRLVSNLKPKPIAGSCSR